MVPNGVGLSALPRLSWAGGWGGMGTRGESHPLSCEDMYVTLWENESPPSPTTLGVGEDVERPALAHGAAGWNPTISSEADCVRTGHGPQPHCVPRNHGDRDCAGAHPGQRSSWKTTGLERINENRSVFTLARSTPGKGRSAVPPKGRVPQTGCECVSRTRWRAHTGSSYAPMKKERNAPLMLE